MRLIVLTGLALAIGGCGPGPAAKPDEAAPTEILWDTWGVPHIFAATAPGMFHAFGWAQMTAEGVRGGRCGAPAPRWRRT